MLSKTFSGSDSSVNTFRGRRVLTTTFPRVQNRGHFKSKWWAIVRLYKSRAWYGLNPIYFVIVALEPRYTTTSLNFDALHYFTEKSAKLYERVFEVTGEVSLWVTNCALFTICFLVVDTILTQINKIKFCNFKIKKIYSRSNLVQ